MKNIKIVAVTFLLLGLLSFLIPSRALAAAAQCSTGAGPSTCTPGGGNYNIDGGTFKADHCYSLVRFGDSTPIKLVWQDVGCGGIFGRPALCSIDSNVTVCTPGGSYIIEGGAYQENHCYSLLPISGTEKVEWQDVGCGGIFAPFTVKCDNGTTVSYTGTTTPAQACAGSGGYTSPGTPGTPPPEAVPLPDPSGDTSCTLNNGESASSCTIFQKYLFPAIDFLTVGVGIVVTIMIVIGGIQYSSARGDPNAVAQAKRRITNALLGLVAFGLFWAFIQWIVPGGIL